MASLWGARTEDASRKGRRFAAALHERRGIRGLADFPRPPPDAAATRPPPPSARPPAGSGRSGTGRQSFVAGKRVEGRLNFGGVRRLKKKKRTCIRQKRDIHKT